MVEHEWLGRLSEAAVGEAIHMITEKKKVIV
jgi:hypothetical protein